MCFLVSIFFPTCMHSGKVLNMCWTRDKALASLLTVTSEKI